VTERSPDAGRPGPIALIGGAEFLPGNEAHDRLLVDAAGALDASRPAFVLATAAARQDPDSAVRTAVRWYGGLGLGVEELPVRTRTQANSSAIAEQARNGRFFVLAGGDPGYTATTLQDSQVWAAVLEAWRGGAVLAGSSAGAMALGGWTLIRSRFPGDGNRAARPALAVVPRIAVLPHFDTFGERWIPSASDAVREEGGGLLVGIPEKSAALWSDDRWRAVGGTVTIIATDTPDDRNKFPPGADIPILPAPTA
jgi:cyanophycinase